MLVLVLVNIASLNIVHNHFCFNDYMERIISSRVSVLSLSPPLSSFFRADCHPLPGEYGKDLEQMGFNDESETDYLDSVKFCADLVWHGEIFQNKP